MSTTAAEASRREKAEQERYRCLVCQQTFGRVEHLTRHSWSHSDKRLLKCDYCHKGFYRGSVDAHRFLLDFSPFCSSEFSPTLLETHRLTWRTAMLYGAMNGSTKNPREADSVGVSELVLPVQKRGEGAVAITLALLAERGQSIAVTHLEPMLQSKQVAVVWKGIL